MHQNAEKLKKLKVWYIMVNSKFSRYHTSCFIVHIP